ncbi:hypothetical protein MA16_Dca027844 [Dendrobium catenatum]|uniref:Uncharacterized protein n=1 Tax=Dendrobium catenatum TaxID=906689 RepID=A0A2I0VEE9_9ASPA|nr:hypothetical protein MA16_Dca027844 [Dendrobium catenatum]
MGSRCRGPTKPSRAPTRLGRQPVRRQNRSLNFLFVLIRACPIYGRSVSHPLSSHHALPERHAQSSNGTSLQCGPDRNPIRQGDYMMPVQYVCSDEGCYRSWLPSTRIFSHFRQWIGSKIT